MLNKIENIMEKEENIVSPQEVSEEILLIVKSSRSASQNNASILITWDSLPFEPRNRFDIRNYLTTTIINEAEKKGFHYCKDLSDRDKLEFR